MRYADESWIRLYIRDTMTWLSWTWEAQGLFCCLIRKLDRAGMMELEGYQPALVVSIQTRWPIEVVEKALPQLMRPDSDGVPTIDVVNGCLIATRFVEAQNASNSGAKRSKEYRARQRELARAERYGVRTALRVSGPRTEKSDALEKDDARDTLLESEDSPWGPDDTFPEPDLNATETAHSTGGTFTEPRDSEFAQTTESSPSITTETPDSTVTKRDAKEHTVTESNMALRTVTNRLNLTRQREERRGSLDYPEPSGDAQLTPEPHKGRASAPALSVSFASKKPTARSAAGGEPEEVGQVFDWLLAARKQIQPRARREQCNAHTVSLVLRPMKELSASLLDWKRAIDGTLADVKKANDRGKYRYLSLDTLSKPHNFRRALENADAHGVKEPLSEAQAASERAAQERALAEEEARKAELDAQQEIEDHKLIAEADARLALIDAKMGLKHPAERSAP